MGRGLKKDDEPYISSGTSPADEAADASNKNTCHGKASSALQIQLNTKRHICQYQNIDGCIHNHIKEILQIP